MSTSNQSQSDAHVEAAAQKRLDDTINELIKTDRIVLNQLRMQKEFEAFQQLERGPHFTDTNPDVCSMSHVLESTVRFVAVATTAEKKGPRAGEFKISVTPSLKKTLEKATFYKDHQGLTVFQFSTFARAGADVEIFTNGSSCGLSTILSTTGSSSFITAEEIKNLRRGSLSETLSLDETDINDFVASTADIGEAAVKQIKECLLVSMRVEPLARRIIKTEDQCRASFDDYDAKCAKKKAMTKIGQNEIDEIKKAKCDDEIKKKNDSNQEEDSKKKRNMTMRSGNSGTDRGPVKKKAKKETTTTA